MPKRNLSTELRSVVSEPPIYEVILLGGREVQCFGNRL